MRTRIEAMFAESAMPTFRKQLAASATALATYLSPYVTQRVGTFPGTFGEILSCKRGGGGRN
jgi:hypothetical protein